LIFRNYEKIRNEILSLLIIDNNLTKIYSKFKGICNNNLSFFTKLFVPKIYLTMKFLVKKKLNFYERRAEYCRKKIAF
jgi:hypothetical protein